MKRSLGVVGCYNGAIKARALHSWDVNTVVARDIQRRLASEAVRRSPLDNDPKLVAGVDLSPPDQDGKARGAAVVMRLPDMEIVEVKTAKATPKMPYIPALFRFESRLRFWPL